MDMVPGLKIAEQEGKKGLGGIRGVHGGSDPNQALPESTSILPSFGL
jgi:hypothetical protein